MKHLFLTLVCLFLTGLSAMAQSDSLAQAYSRIKSLEDKLEHQNSQINKLSTDVNEVLKQNLALKKNLNLQPTIATAKSGGIEYSVVELTGDPTSNVVTGIMMVENNGLKEETITYVKPVIVDENGVKYNNFDSFKANFDGDQSSLLNNLISYPTKVPMKIIITINGVSPETKYIKYFELVQRVGDNAVFQNLPIKWAEQ